MALRDLDPGRLEANRNICGGVFGVASAAAGLAYVVGAPLAARIALAAIAVAAAVAVLCFHILERRAREVMVIPEERVVPRAEIKKPQKFVNRCAELSQLNAVLARVERGEGPLVAVLGGLPGAGKSALGKQWVHLVRERFDDGDLLADFSKRRRGGPGVDVRGVLADFIRRLSPAGAIVPATLEERAERFRSLTFDRKLLVLLDDVTEAAEVSQLEPLGKECLLVATSYRAFQELHQDGAEYVPVDPLKPEQAKEMLMTMAGDRGEAFEREGKETEKLLTYCGGLALPLCVCASRLLLGGEGLSVAVIAATVADEQQRLEYLSGVGEYAGAAVFGFAYADLPESQKLAYRRLGLHPGVDLAPVHAALLTGAAPSEAAEKMAALAGTYLLGAAEGGRYRFHDLVRLHARECAEREEPEDEREELVRRLANWYRAALRRADWALTEERLRLAPSDSIEAPHLPTFVDKRAAFDWLEGERANVLAVLQAVRDREWDDWGWQMVESLWLFHYNRRHYADWIDATEIGIECARRTGHRDAETRLRTQLAWALVELRHFERAREELDRANELVRSSSNVQLRGSVREFTGAYHLMKGEYDTAIETLEEARVLAAEAETNRGVALQDYFIGWALIEKGEYEQARVPLAASLKRMRKAGDEMFIGRLLLRLGQAERRSGNLGEAEKTLREGMKKLRELGLRIEMAETYDEFAELAEARGDEATARRERERAQRVYRALGHPRAGESTVIGPASAVDPMAI
jgi:tetratricopeptide (TPR) repeat protein